MRTSIDHLPDHRQEAIIKALQDQVYVLHAYDGHEQANLTKDEAWARIKPELVKTEAVLARIMDASNLDSRIALTCKLDGFLGPH